MPDICTSIKDDHQHLKRHLGHMIVLSQHDQPLDKNDLDILRSLLLSHSRAEEHILYDALKQNPQTQAMAYKSYEEHHLVESSLRELEQLSDPRVLTAKLQVLKETLEHHMDAEENEILPLARALLQPGELERMDMTFQDLKERIQSDILGEPLSQFEPTYRDSFARPTH